ncbi:hypothetical protein [Sinomonas sp. ASV322]|uniref:hypothetical protein n=1 Tax=Sinomonas sp. ASV322 TaxID=3041920 RepID=UPI0027DDD78E|nr:hypothetical protein [Sinomonas sp. ASV322]MDQ4502772.1 hypothetical protein [Sinomonas sp. ASV322]
MAFPPLGIAVTQTSPTFRHDLLELGLASENRKRAPLGSVFGTSLSRATVLPSGWRSSVAVALSHYARAMFRVFVLLGLVLVAGLGTGLTSLAGLALAGFFLACSILVHELGHVAAYRLLGGSMAPGIAVAKGMRCHLVRRGLPPWRDLLVAAAGPLAPGFLVPFLVPFLWVAPLTCGAWLAIALGHALCALWPVGDGVTIWGAVAQLSRRRRAARSDASPRSLL